VNERWLEVDVGDDGCGFDAAGGNGNGLPNMRQRMADVGGRFDLASEAGRGTRISFAVPLVPRDGG
jgi:signal transduction histidine kinase